MLHKFSHNGVTRYSHALFDSYLSGRTISIDFFLHSSSEVVVGVPLGSVLGLLLSLVYVINHIMTVNRQKPTVCFCLCYTESVQCSKKSIAFSG